MKQLDLNIKEINGLISRIFGYILYIPIYNLYIACGMLNSIILEGTCTRKLQQHIYKRGYSANY